MSRRLSLRSGERGGGGRGAESYDRKKAPLYIAQYSPVGRDEQNEIKAERWLGSVGIQLCF
jgi:hypothetical protein